MNVIPRTSRARWQLFGLTLVEVFIILTTIVALFLTWYEGGCFDFVKRISKEISNGKYYFLLLRILLTIFFCASLLFLLLPVWKKQKGYVLADSIFAFVFQPQNFVFPNHFELGFYEEEKAEQQEIAEKDKITAEQLYHQKLILILEAMTSVLDQNKKMLGELSQKTLALQQEHDGILKNLTVLVGELIKSPATSKQRSLTEKPKQQKIELDKRKVNEEFSSEEDDFKNFFETSEKQGQEEK